MLLPASASSLEAEVFSPLERSGMSVAIIHNVWVIETTESIDWSRTDIPFPAHFWNTLRLRNWPVQHRAMIHSFTRGNPVIDTTSSSFHSFHSGRPRFLEYPFLENQRNHNLEVPYLSVMIAHFVNILADRSDLFSLCANPLCVCEINIDFRRAVSRELRALEKARNLMVEVDA